MPALAMRAEKNEGTAEVNMVHLVNVECGEGGFQSRRGM
jgi:hypothetical protein